MAVKLKENKNTEWKKTISRQLQDRNRRESEAFGAIVQAHNKLFEHADTYKTKNVQLTVEVEKLKHDNLELQIKLESGGAGSGTPGEATQALQQKIYQLQDELTTLHRKKGENAQQLIDLNNKLQEKEKELQGQEAKVNDLGNQVSGLQEANRHLEESLMESEKTNQFLIDEQQTLQLAFVKLEEKFRKMVEDNNELVARWMEYKSKEADKLNEYNEEVYKAKQLAIKKDLEDATFTKVDIDLPQDPRQAICLGVSIPRIALQSFDAHEGEVNAIRWSPTGRLFATGGTDRKLKLWEVRNGKCETKGILTGSNAAIMSVEFDLEENFMLAASNDFACRVWTLADHRLRHTLTGHSGKVLAAKFLGDQAKIVSGSHDRTLKLWDLRSKACTQTLFAGSSCNDLVTSDSTNVISGHFDRKIRFWDTRSESHANEISLNDRITSLDLSPDKTCLLSCSRDHTIMLIDLKMNQVTTTLSADGFKVGCDWTRAVFSPDGEYLMAGSSDGNLFIWNVLKSKLETVLRDQHNHAILGCSWNPMGNSLLSCDKHRTVVYWADF